MLLEIRLACSVFFFLLFSESQTELQFSISYTRDLLEGR